MAALWHAAMIVSAVFAFTFAIALYHVPKRGRGGPAERRGDTAPQPWQRGRSGFM
jgi:hypothetical protein